MESPQRRVLLRFMRAARAFMDPEGNPPANTGEFVDLKRALSDAENVLREEERATLHLIAERIVGNASPEEDDRLGVAFAISRYLGLGWESAAEQITHQDEDLLEALYWEFDSERKKHPENERILFKGFLRAYHSNVNRRVFPNNVPPPGTAGESSAPLPGPSV